MERMTKKGSEETAGCGERELLALKVEWQKYFKNAPPKKSNREFLIKNIGWQKQAKEYGVSLTKFHKMMDRALLRYELGKRVKPELIVKAGTKFIRQWRGERHEATVAATAAGSVFIYNGESYKSLSAIARKITGTQWNGKLFFGVKR